MTQYGKYIYLLAAAALCLAAACTKNSFGTHTFGNVVYLDVSSTSEEQITTISNSIPETSRTLSPVLAYPEERDVCVTIEVDPGMVAEYNRKHGTEWTILDQKYYEFRKAEVTIPSGKVSGNDVLTVSFRNLMGEGEEQTGALGLDETYLLPVRITSSDMDILEGSSTAYYVVKRSSAITVVAQLGMGNWINFPTLDTDSPGSEAFNGLTAVTYEAWIYIDAFMDKTVTSEGSELGINISSIMGVEQSLLLRIGDTSYEREQLQFDGSGTYANFGKFPKRDATKKLESNRWYHVACTYDQNTRTVCIYLNGKMQSMGTEMGITVPGEDNRINLAMRALYDRYVKDPSPENEKYSTMNEAYQFFIAKSYDAYRPLNGKIAEARVWSVARTEQEIRDNMYKIEDPESHGELIGYWKFNDGSGNIIRDYSRYHNDGVAEIDIIWPSGMEIPIISD